jgi:hypothetical protein
MFCDDGEKCSLRCTDERRCRDKPARKLREALAEIREIWAGSEGGEPVTAQEAYFQMLCKQMYQLSVNALMDT